MPDTPAQRLLAAEQRLDAVAPGYLQRARQLAGALAMKDRGDGDVRAVLRDLEETAAFDVDVPVLSRRRAGRYVKSSIKAAVAWYFRYVGQQLIAFGETVAAWGEIVTDRLVDLEQSTAELQSEVARLKSRLSALEAGDRTLP